jgi:hypothetical protein
MVPALPPVIARTFRALMQQQQLQQLWLQLGWHVMQRAMPLLLQLSRASLWLLCGSRWWHEQVRMLAGCKRLHL